MMVNEGYYHWFNWRTIEIWQNWWNDYVWPKLGLWFAWYNARKLSPTLSDEAEVFTNIYPQSKQNNLIYLWLCDGLERYHAVTIHSTLMLVHCWTTFQALRSRLGSSSSCFGFSGVTAPWCFWVAFRLDRERTMLESPNPAAWTSASCSYSKALTIVTWNFFRSGCA